MLQSMDSQWREHLAALDHLRQGIHLRGYAQKNPKQEYKREAFELFETLLDLVRKEVTRIVFTVQIRSAEDVEETAPHADVQNVQYQHADYDEALGRSDDAESASAPRHRMPARRLAETILVLAVAVKNTNIATENCPDPPRHPRGALMLLEPRECQSITARHLPINFFPCRAFVSALPKPKFARKIAAI